MPLHLTREQTVHYSALDLTATMSLVFDGQ